MSSEDVGKDRILYCHCAYAKVVPEDVKNDVLEGLAASRVAFDAVGDLCEMSARKDPALERLGSGEDGTTRIVACFPRAVRWLFHAAGHQLDEGAEVLNMREESAAEILEQLGLPAEKEARS